DPPRVVAHHPVDRDDPAGAPGAEAAAHRGAHRQPRRPRLQRRPVAAAGEGGGARARRARRRRGPPRLRRVRLRPPHRHQRHVARPGEEPARRDHDPGRGSALVIRLAIFDLDGTLVDSRLDLSLAVNHALRVVGLPERTLDEVASFVGEGAVKLVERAVAPRVDLVGPALAAWWEHYEAHLLDNTVLYPGLAELLAEAPCALAVHTNKP